VILCISVIFERYLIPIFDKFGEQEITAGSLVLAIFSCMMPGILCFLCGFYCLLHSWMNASAEMLKFADRMFYTDWWNATSFPNYYRTWNIVVHDWLYTYIYKDMCEHVLKGHKTLPMLTVFAISAIFHEFIMGVAFRFLYPVMFFFFGGISVLLMFVKNKKHQNLGNMLLWLALCLGNGLMLSLYNMEYYARSNCPLEGKSMLDYLIPVSWYCHGIAPNPNWEIKAPWQE
jgi:sterol O-acyltransferase